jgi:hypothetical protein
VPRVYVSALQGQGLDTLRAVIARAARGEPLIPGKPAPIDAQLADLHALEAPGP